VHAYVEQLGRLSPEIYLSFVTERESFGSLWDHQKIGVGLHQMYLWID
jgi:hypothetical protein